MSDAVKQRYSDLGMVDTVQSDMPDAIPTKAEMDELLERVKDMTKTRPLEQIYEKVTSRGAFDNWEALTFEEQNCMLAIWACYRAQLRDNVRALADQAS